jgi:hypothetical protein
MSIMDKTMSAMDKTMSMMDKIMSMMDKIMSSKDKTMSMINKKRLKYGDKTPNCNKTPPAGNRETRFGHGFLCK